MSFFLEKMNLLITAHIFTQLVIGFHYHSPFWLYVVWGQGDYWKRQHPSGDYWKCRNHILDGLHQITSWIELETHLVCVRAADKLWRLLWIRNQPHPPFHPFKLGFCLFFSLTIQNVFTDYLFNLSVVEVVSVTLVLEGTVAAHLKDDLLFSWSFSSYHTQISSPRDVLCSDEMCNPNKSTSRTF